ncbi:MAG: DUF2924 domain-containing protein [Terriglobia bacterium]|jgi:hypothetical protein
MSADFTDRLAALPTMKRRELMAVWRQLYKRKAPPQMRSGLLVQILAYRIQEQAYGGLSAETRKRLHELARKLEANPRIELSGVVRIKPGTRLIRDWRGQSHCVTVLENGYEYAGKGYPSLSQIARLITGTRWSGPLFFGLRGKHAREDLNARRS